MPTPMTTSPAALPRCAPPACLAALAALLAACGGGGGDALPVPSPFDRFTIGGTVSGLAAPGTAVPPLVLQNNEGDDLVIPTNGSFTFATPIAVGHPYAVRVKSQPAFQFCTVPQGSGAMPGAPVDSVQVACALDKWSGVPEGIWQAVSCDTLRAGNGQRTVWRIVREDESHLAIASGVTHYAAPECGGQATQQWEPGHARFAFEVDGKHTRGPITTFRGQWTHLSPPGNTPVRATFARTGSHVCWDVYTLQDTAGEENASTQARQCFQLLAN